MAIGLVGPTTTSNTLVASKSTGVVAGTVMLIALSSYDDTAQVITPAAGWALVARVDYLGYITFAIYWKLAGASEPATYTFTSTQNSGVGICFLGYSGVDNVTPIDAAATTNTGTGTTATGLAVTASTAGCELILGFGGDNNRITTPTGMANEVTGTTSDGGVFNMYDQALVSAGSTGNRTGTLSSDDWTTIMFALRPAGGAAPAQDAIFFGTNF